ncbi:hypothetical protein [Bacterioplanoides sp.]|uniref:hypothetical protein n=1 Tax=Bacterioplanoides sp. TaxID=2066072 RepID=UPI003B00DF25
MKKCLLLSLIFISQSLFSQEQKALWVWQGNTSEHTFSITLSKSENGYSGTYCAIGMAGRRTDCSANSAETFSTALSGEIFEFKTNYSRALGTASITLIGEELHWEIIKAPNGEHYAPKEALLKRHQ